MTATPRDPAEAPGARVCRVAAGPAFLDACAGHILSACEALLPDLSAVQVVLPNLMLGPALRVALARAAARPLLLPRMHTLSGWVDPLLAGQTWQSPSARQFGLFGALRPWKLIEGNSRWQVTDALIALFDELGEHAAPFPPDEAALDETLGRGYGLAANAPMSFEAKLTHALWRADGEGTPSLPRAREARLDALAREAQAPLIFIAETEPLARVRAWLARYAERAPVLVLLPDCARADAADSPLPLLRAAWSEVESDSLEDVLPALRTRALALNARQETRLDARVRLTACASLEGLAAHVAAQVRAWLDAGRREIALVAADRVAARRARALLERDGILVADETGWKLSTTRAAALIDAWHEFIAGDAYHRDLADLVKSPFLSAGLEEAARAEAIDALENLVAKRNIVAGFDVLARALDATPEAAAAQPLVAALAAARAAFPTAAAEPAQWIARMLAALDALGARAPLAADAAGAQLLELLAARAAELAAVNTRLNFADWREWLDRQLEAATFRDVTIASPVVMTHLAATRLRPFDAAIVIGADREHLAANPGAALFAHDAVRRELGLPDSRAAVARLREDLTLLIAQSGETDFAWQAAQGDETVLPAIELELLSLAHEIAFGDDLRRPALAAPAVAACEALAPQSPPSPHAPVALLPARVSASAYQSLINCPYQFFASYVLGLGEREEVTEALEKRDYGERVHELLARFHERFRRVSDHADDVLLTWLDRESRAAFAEEISRNYLELAWLERWLGRLEAYLAWQRAREAEGWTFAAAEQRRERGFELEGGAAVSLHGRLDRIDAHAESGEAVLDYKTQGASALAAKLKLEGEDVQLAVYALLQGEAVGAADYVALDDDKIATRGLTDTPGRAEREAARLTATFAALHAGAPMPAQGAEHVCAWCAMRGLCRRDFTA